MPYLTPDTPSGDTLARRLCIPVEIAHIVSGALYDLIAIYNWEKFGTLTPEEAVALAWQVLDCYNQEDDDAMIGELVSYLSTNPPYGVLQCTGQTLNNAAYPLLAASLDAVFDNGDGTFTLPDFRGRTVIGEGAGPGLTNRAFEATGGEETHLLTTAEMPSHLHSVNDNSLTAVFIAPGEVPAVVTLVPGVTGSTGGGGAHNNMPPYGVAKIGIRYASPLSEQTVIITRNVGEILAMAVTAAPSGYLACDGSSHLRVDYPELYAALDAAFIVDANNFVTPDLRGRTVIGTGTGTGLTARAMNAATGTETHLLAIGEIPSHAHSATGRDGLGTTATARNGSTSPGTAIPTTSVGGGGAHNNMQPSRALKYFIVATTEAG